MLHWRLHQMPQAAAIVIGLALLSASHGLSAQKRTGPCAAVRTQDELWLVSSRRIECRPCTAPNVACLTAARYAPCQGWREASIDEFLHGGQVAASSDPGLISPAGRVTVVYATGNRDDAEETLEDGLEVYAALVACNPIVSVRFVIWSWPSDKIFGPLRDFRVKAERADCEAYLLGWLITQMPSAEPLSLIGYSFGARIVNGALHLAAGGELDGCLLPPGPSLGAISARVVLLAPAVESDWLLPGRLHGLALTQVDRMWASYNPCDPVLKRYRFIVKHANPVALGFAGPASGPWPEEYLDRLQAQDVRREIGKTHWMEAYIESPVVAARMRAFALWSPLGPLDAAALP